MTRSISRAGAALRRRTPRHRAVGRAGLRLWRPDRPERRGQPPPDDDARRLPRRRGALHHGLPVRRWRRGVRLADATPRDPVERREGRRLDAPAPRPRDGPGPRGASRRPRPGRCRLGRGADEGPHRRPRRHRPARRRRGSRHVGDATTASASRPTRPRSSTSTPPARRSSWPPSSMPMRPPQRGQAVGDGTPVHVTIPTDNPWVPLRILALGKTAAERVDADVYLLTDRRPALLPAPTGANGLGLGHSAPATDSLLDDLRSDRGMGWVPSSGWLTKVTHRRRGAAARLRPRDRRVGRRRAVAGHGRAGPAGLDGRRRTGRADLSRTSSSGSRSRSAASAGSLLLSDGARR